MQRHDVSTHIMPIGSDIRKLGHCLEAFEGGTGTVTGVDIAARSDSTVGPTADVDLTVPAVASAEQSAEIAFTDVTIDADGRLRAALESTTPLFSTTDRDVELEPTGATVTSDGAIAVTLDVSVSGEDEPADAAESDSAVREEADDDAVAPDRDRNVPPFRDPELLATVYESCDTFVEMSDAIDMDVTAETVRRYMIDHGIHEPNSYDTDDESTGEVDRGGAVDPSEPDADAGPTAASEPGRDSDRSPVVLTDGIGLPDDVTVDALVETVSRSNTIYEVERDIGLDRDETLALLRRLDLVDLVVGRVADVYERDIGRAEIVERLRDVSVEQR